ncbi:MAG: mobile mystery protein B [Candidatus Algichlamydia australiensis]|nr:mobile mystery protein B [Chlamydiales bacterium]
MKKKFAFPKNATPLNDCSGLIPNWIHTLNDLNRAEANNILLAQRKYLRGKIKHPKIWFHPKELKNIHKAMFGSVWSWAGIYRKSVTSIGIKPSLIAYNLAKFCLEVSSWFEEDIELSIIEKTARVHHQLVFIHPFENGNGRFSRFIADRFLLSFQGAYPIWPRYLNQDSEDRKEYIRALQEADQGVYTLLINFMKKHGACEPNTKSIVG